MESADAPVSPPTSPVKLPRDGSISIVLDWDDTLLPTTQLTDNYGDYITGGAPLPAHIVEELSALEDIAVEFLDEVAACGEATVITNAMNGSPPFHALLRLRAWPPPKEPIPPHAPPTARVAPSFGLTQWLRTCVYRLGDAVRSPVRKLAYSPCNPVCAVFVAEPARCSALRVPDPTSAAGSQSP